MQSTTKKKRLSIQSNDSTYTDEEIDKNIKNVTLDPPKTAFDFFLEEKNIIIYLTKIEKSI